MSHAAGLKLLRRVLTSFTHKELKSALNAELRDFDFNRRPPRKNASKPEIVNRILDALNGKGPDDTFNASSKIHCWYLRKQGIKSTAWQMFRIQGDATGAVDYELKDVPAFMDALQRAARGTSWEVRASWELEDSAVYCCFVLRDLPKSLTTRVLYLTYFPDFPLIAVRSTVQGMYKLLLECLQKALPAATVEREDVPRTDLISTFRFCVSRMGMRLLSTMKDMPARIRPVHVTYAEPEVETGTENLTAEDRQQRKRKATDFFGPDELPVLKKHRRELLDEDDEVTVSVTLESSHVLEDLRKLYVLGHLHKLDKALKRALEGEEVVQLRRRQ